MRAETALSKRSTLMRVRGGARKDSDRLDRHVERVEGVLEHKVGVELIQLLHQHIDI
jgi:hypothetical protein